MVKAFQFARVPKIIFQNGAIKQLAGLSASYGREIVLVTGRESFLNSSHAEILFEEFQKTGVIYRIIQIDREPSPEMVDRAVSELFDDKFDVVVSIGGGSVIDAGKAISAMTGKSESVTGYLEGVGTKIHPGTKLPFIAIPTTSGTGSEATKNAVLSSVGEKGFKRSLRHDNFVPDIALVDPDLTIPCPREITAASGMDCFTQLLEAYLSDKSCEYTDALSMAGLKAIKSSLIESINNGNNPEARKEMSFAALTSGICLANAGLGVVHGFASSIGGMFNIPHGMVCGTLMGASNEINVRKLRKEMNNPLALKKYASAGKLFLAADGKNDDYYIDGFLSYLNGLTNELNLSELGKYGIKEDDIIKICQKTETKNNPVKLDPEDLAEILTKRL